MLLITYGHVLSTYNKTLFKKRREKDPDVCNLLLKGSTDKIDQQVGRLNGRTDGWVGG